MENAGDVLRKLYAAAVQRALATARVVPLFLRPDQTFVDATDLKADLLKLDAYYWQCRKR